MKRYVQLVIVSLIVGNNGYSEGKKSDVGEFVITPKQTSQKKLSQTSLKEHIGNATKQTFQHLITLNQSMGHLQCRMSRIQLESIQHEPFKKDVDGAVMRHCAVCSNVLGRSQLVAADIEKKCSLIVEKLIDNEPPFKKASKVDLNKTLQFLNATAQQFQQHNVKLVQLQADLDAHKNNKSNETLVKKAAQELEQLEKSITTIATSFKTDDCLKKL